MKIKTFQFLLSNFCVSNLRKVLILLSFSFIFTACIDNGMSAEDEIIYYNAEPHSSSSIIITPSSNSITPSSNSNIQENPLDSSSSIDDIQAEPVNYSTENDYDYAEVKVEETCDMSIYDSGCSQEYLRTLCAKFKAQGYYSFQNCSCTAITK